MKVKVILSPLCLAHSFSSVVQTHATCVQKTSAGSYLSLLCFITVKSCEYKKKTSLLVLMLTSMGSEISLCFTHSWVWLGRIFEIKPMSSTFLKLLFFILKLLCLCHLKWKLMLETIGKKWGVRGDRYICIKHISDDETRRPLRLGL